MTIMDEVKERAEDVDQGVFCPHDDCAGLDACMITGIIAHDLYGECPTHGEFCVDFDAEYYEALADQQLDAAYMEYA